MTYVYVLASDILASMASLGFARPTSVPDDVVCEGQIVVGHALKGRTYVKFVDADGLTFNVELNRTELRSSAGELPVVVFPAAEKEGQL